MKYFDLKLVFSNLVARYKVIQLVALFLLEQKVQIWSGLATKGVPY